MFGLVMDTRPMTQLCENQFFHNSISCNNIQGTDSSLGKKQRKRERMAAFSFSAYVVAVATLDGCVCQGGRPFSLMMAMPSHKPSSAVCVCGSDSSSIYLSAAHLLGGRILTYNRAHTRTFEL